jgi:hypothetical protein
MMKFVRAGALLVTVAIGVACTACTNDANSPAAAPSTPSSAAASSTQSSASGDVPPPPKVGQCRNTPARSLGFNDWVDRSPVVDCSRTHTLETAAVIKPGVKLTLSLVQQLVDTNCGPAAFEYLGEPSRDTVRRLVFPAAYWPSAAQRAAAHAESPIFVETRAEPRSSNAACTDCSGGAPSKVNNATVRP